MADGAVTLLPFEATGSGTTGKQHASSGESLQFQYLSVSGAQYAHASVAGTLPALTGAGHMRADNRASVAGTLPSLTGVAYCGSTADITLPALQGSASGTNTLVASLDATLPALQGSASGTTGAMAEAAGTLPALKGVAYGGATMRGTLPKLTGASAGRTESHATVEVFLPALQGTALGHRSADSATMLGVLPALVAVAGVRMEANLPKLQGSARASNGAPITVGAWAFNTEKNAVTEFTNFGFLAFVRFKDKHYGIGRDGNLYLMQGDTDNATPIAWQFETGLDDLGSAAQKGVRAVYLDGVIEKGAELTLVTDTGTRYTYATGNATNAIDHRTYRVVTGKGIRTRNLGIAMSSTKGGYCEVDMISPKYDISKRSV